MSITPICVCCHYYAAAEEQKKMAQGGQATKYTVSSYQVSTSPWANGVPLMTTTDLSGSQTTVHPFTNITCTAPTSGQTSGAHNVPTLGQYPTGAHNVPTHLHSPGAGYVVPTAPPKQNTTSHVFPNRWSKQGPRNYNGFSSDFGQFRHIFVPRAGGGSNPSGGDSPSVFSSSSDAFPPSYAQLGFGSDWGGPPDGSTLMGGSSGFSSSDACGGGGSGGFTCDAGSSVTAACDSGFSGGGGCDSGCGGGFSSCD